MTKEALVDALITKDLNLHGRRVRGAAFAIDLKDYVPLDQINKLITKAINELPSTAVNISNVNITYCTLAAIPTTWTVRDTNRLVCITDYAHLLRWTGTAWTWGPGEEGIHPIVMFPVDPNPTTGWQLCDGTTVAYLKSDGTTANFVTPDLTSAGNKAAYAKLGTPVGVNAAVAPTITNALVTGSGAANLGNANAAVNVVQTGATFVAANATHTHFDSGHTHTIAATTSAADGEPRNYILRPWFRR